MHCFYRVSLWLCCFAHCCIFQFIFRFFFICRMKLYQMHNLSSTKPTSIHVNLRPADIRQPHTRTTHYRRTFLLNLSPWFRWERHNAVRMVSGNKNLSLPLHVARLQLYRAINFTISPISNWLNHIATCNASILCYAIWSTSVSMSPIVELVCNRTMQSGVQRTDKQGLFIRCRRKIVINVDSLCKRL